MDEIRRRIDEIERIARRMELRCQFVPKSFGEPSTRSSVVAYVLITAGAALAVVAILT